MAETTSQSLSEGLTDCFQRFLSGLPLPALTAVRELLTLVAQLIEAQLLQAKAVLASLERAVIQLDGDITLGAAVLDKITRAFDEANFTAAGCLEDGMLSLLVQRKLAPLKRKKNKAEDKKKKLSVRKTAVKAAVAELEEIQQQLDAWQAAVARVITEKAST